MLHPAADGLAVLCVGVLGLSEGVFFVAPDDDSLAVTDSQSPVWVCTGNGGPDLQEFDRIATRHDELFEVPDLSGQYVPLRMIALPDRLAGGLHYVRCAGVSLDQLGAAREKRWEVCAALNI